MLKKFDAEMKRRLAMTLGGVLISGFSVGMFQFSLMGMDPFQVFAHGIWTQLLHIMTGGTPRFFTEFDPANAVIGYGIVYMIINMVMVIVFLVVFCMRLLLEVMFGVNITAIIILKLMVFILIMLMMKVTIM